MQSSELAGLNLLTLELISRLNTYWNQAGEVQVWNLSPKWLS